jgi:hypothetical protein
MIPTKNYEYIPKNMPKVGITPLSRINHPNEDFSEESFENFGENERGSEDIIDMMQKGNL